MTGEPSGRLHRGESTDDGSSSGLTRRAALAAVGAGAATSLAGCLGGGREEIVLTGMELYNWTGASITVEVTLSAGGSELLATTETVGNSSSTRVVRDWPGEAAAYRLQVEAVDTDLAVDADLPDGTWARGRCAWAEVDFGSPNRQRDPSGATEAYSADARLRDNDEGPFGEQCPAE
ncbi:hypothetical protein I7X12_06780 [Halosimplex litoreum]|uniref:Uncharacterized protein n=1 Tax=Halosimplex litoreum TaxID=1198301 RepID=A0A7T3G1P2_9EURY|nr:hypothetical protein [Halosimplex litoreum]QPV64313.1 hypothetical protein I7X12_06780 [Halosimplex litoreum]